MLRRGWFRIKPVHGSLDGKRGQRLDKPHVRDALIIINIIRSHP